jgi:hypothetical protein
VEISGSEAHIFPYQHLVAASLVHENTADVLRLAFSSHDIEITGRNLREILVSIQEFGVKWLRTIPERYQSVTTAQSGLIFHIRIAPAA